MTKTDETFQEAVLALRDWLAFLEEKAKEFQEQLERARRKAEKESGEGSVTVTEEQEEYAAQPAQSEPASGEMPDWL